MAELRIVNGPGAGNVIPLGPASVVIGRDPKSDVFISSNYVSRNHARIEWREGRHVLTDLGTANGTYVNHQRHSATTPLKSNDQIEIGDHQLVFLDRGSPRDATEAAQPLFRALAEGAEEGNGRMQLRVSLCGSVEDECRRLRESLETNHVFLVRAEATALPQQLDAPGSPALQILGRGFHRVAILDGAAGQEGPEGSFDLERFLRHAYERMVQTFGLRASPESFHVENVSQILKDEPRSLFCFRNVQLIPAADLRRLRGFTQEAHQVLFLCRGERDLAREEAAEAAHDWSSSVTDLTVSTQRAGDPEVLDLCDRWHQAADLESLFQHIGEDLLRLFRQADRVFVILAEEGAETTSPPRLVPRVFKASHGGAADQDRFSRIIVWNCLQRVEASLSNTTSAHELATRSVLCVPLGPPAGKPFGVLQIDTQDWRNQFTADDLKLLGGLAHQAATAIDVARLRQKAVQLDKLHRDLEFAWSLQRTCYYPQRLPEVPGYDFHAFASAARGVSGDYYDFIRLAPNRWAVALGDVAGMGVAAAMLVPLLSATLRSCLLREAEPGRALAQLNDQLYPVTAQADRFISLALVFLDTEAHLAQLLSAGHPSPLLYHATSRTLDPAIPSKQMGVPLGIMEGFPFEAKPVTLAPGDCLLLYTDGIEDAAAPDGAVFGRAAVCQAALATDPRSPQAFVERILQASRQFTAGRPFGDDVTLVGVGRRPSDG